MFVQAGPVVNVYVPKDRVSNAHQGYGFVEFANEEDADYVRRSPRSVSMLASSSFVSIWSRAVSPPSASR